MFGFNFTDIKEKVKMQAGLVYLPFLFSDSTKKWGHIFLGKIKVIFWNLTQRISENKTFKQRDTNQN